MRRDSREIAFKIIFEGFFNEEPFNEEILSNVKEKDKDFLLDIIDKYNENKDEIEESVKKYLIDYKLDRVYKVDLALLYEAVTEIKYLGTPAPVAINEVLELAKLYSTENSPKFLNGILSSYVKEN